MIGVRLKTKIISDLLSFFLEPKPLHIVNTTLEMPEGVSLSDNDDKDGKFDPDDPHRALDIELDM